MLTVNTNTSSLVAQTNYTRNQQAVNQVLAELASGSNTNSAADNPAALAISEGLTTQSNGDTQALTNTNDALSLTQTAQGALSELQSNTQQLQQLAIQAGNGTLNYSDRQALQQQVDQLTQANSQIIQTTEFNGTPLLSGNASTTFQLGADANSSAQMTLSSAGLDETPSAGGLNGYNADLNATGTLNVSTQSAALNTQSLLNQDLATLNTTQSLYGATSDSLEATLNTLQTGSINTQAAQANLTGTDYASATAALAQQQILGNADLATLSQANMTPGAALTLLNS